MGWSQGDNQALREQLSSDEGADEARQHQLQTALSTNVRLKAQLQRFENQQLDAGLARIASAQASHFVGLLGAFVPGEVIADDCAALDMLLLLHRVASKEAVLRDHLATCACSCCVVAWRATPASSLTCLLGGQSTMAGLWQQAKLWWRHSSTELRASMVLWQVGLHWCWCSSVLPRA